jgi:hypothetical protein
VQRVHRVATCTPCCNVHTVLQRAHRVAVNGTAQGYGLIAVNSSGKAVQVEKVTHEQARQPPSAANKATNTARLQTNKHSTATNKHTQHGYKQTHTARLQTNTHSTATNKQTQHGYKQTNTARLQTNTHSTTTNEHQRGANTPGQCAPAPKRVSGGRSAATPSRQCGCAARAALRRRVLR